MITLPRSINAPAPSPYLSLGLKDLPFPSTPVVDPYNYDERRNGTIYATGPVEKEIEKFENLLIRPKDFLNRAQLAYLWSKGDQQSGRGMGKTALLRYFRQRINHDWGNTQFEGQFSAIVIYVAFPSQVDRRYMEQLALSALVDICKNGVLDASLAKLRLDQMSQEQATAVLTNPDGVQNPANLLKDDILREHDIDPLVITEKVELKLISEGVEPLVAGAFAQGEFENYLKSFRRDGKLEPLYVPRDTKILDYSRGFLFNDVICYLRAAGFSGGYLFIDDIENLVDQMTRKDRIEFAKEFALCTVRPGYANTKFNFLSSVITTHQQAANILSTAWGEAGLSTIARLDPSSPNSVELPLPSKDQALEIIIAHLNHYQADPANLGTIKPFTVEGLNALLKSQELLHPRRMLANAAKAVQEAMEQGATAIDEAQVKAAIDKLSSVTTPDVTEGIEDAL